MRALLLDDFFAGIVAALRCRDVKELVVDEAFHAGMQAAFGKIAMLAPDIDVRFCIRVHPIYRESEVVREGIARCGVGRLLSLRGTSPEVVSPIVDEAFAANLLEGLPGGPRLYEELVETLLSFCTTGPGQTDDPSDS